MQGSVLCEPAQSKSTQLDISEGKNLQEKCRAPAASRTFCASLCSRNAHEHVARTIYEKILKKKCRALDVSRTFCASLHSRNARGHVARAILCKNYQEKCRAQTLAAAMYAIILRENSAPQERDPHFVRACAVEMHVDMSQEPSDARIYRNKIRAQMGHPDQAPAFTPMNPSMWTHCWGIKIFIKFSQIREKGIKPNLKHSTQKKAKGVAHEQLRSPTVCLLWRFSIVPYCLGYRFSYIL